MRVGFMSTALMVAKLGTDAFAAHQVGMNIMSLTFSFGDGMQRIGNCISIVLAIVYLTGGRMLYRLFFQEEHIIAIGVVIMRLMIVIAVCQIAQVIYMGCLRGAGDVFFTTVASTFSVTIVRTAVSYFGGFVLNWGLPGIWIGVIGDQFCRVVLTTWRFKSGVWTKVEL